MLTAGMRGVVALVAVDIAAVQADVRGALALLRRQLAPKARRRRLLWQPLHVYLGVLALRRSPGPPGSKSCWQRALQIVPWLADAATRGVPGMAAL